MNRRAVLASLGTAASFSIAGCTQAGSIPSPDTDQRVVELRSVDEVPSEHSVEVAVEVLEQTSDADHTARIQISTTNTGKKRALSISLEMCALFNRNRGGSDHPEGLWLHRAESTTHIEREGDRWVADRPSDEPRVYPSYGCLSKVYENDETVTNEYEVWDDYRVTGYLDPGTYRWEERIRIFSAGTEEKTGSDEEPLGSFNWGFDIELGVPDEA